RSVAHNNLNTFVGACVDPPDICLIWIYCPKGSLAHVLRNNSITVDNVFRLSFMMDLAKGMSYLHTSCIVSHGNLKSFNCLIDERWSLKISEYGLPSFLAGLYGSEDQNTVYKKKIWTAPEILRENFPPPRGTQKGDVYSFAIICYEIMTREEPYNFDLIVPRDVISRVRNGESTPYRPQLSELTNMGPIIVDFVKQCWDEVPENRPTFAQIRPFLRKEAGGDYCYYHYRICIMDNVLKTMGKYAESLDDIVSERVQQVAEQKLKTDQLLYRLLPACVADQLKGGNTSVVPEDFRQTTIYFSDIVSFTTLAADSEPMEIVDFLNDLYSCFDAIILRHDVYKVETIGDAYMLVSGAPVRNGSLHSSEIADVSLDLLSAVTLFKIRHRPRKQLQIRIGLHSGPVLAGIVGNIMPRYCLFGETVQIAGKMESTGK
ncbi:Atrial natriuretic peptide receptor 1, partial [Lamellibrachia satsuma]